MAKPAKKQHDWRYSLDSAIGAVAPFMQGGISDIRLPAGLKPHFHEGYEFTYVDRGEVTWKVDNGRDLTLRGGDMALTMPGIVHSGKYEIIQPSHLFWVIFNTSMETAQTSAFTRPELDSIDAILKSAGNSVAKARPLAHVLFAQLFNAAKRLHAGGNVNKAYVRTLVSAMFIEFVNCLSGAAVLRPFNRFEQAIERINTNIDKNISIDELAKLSGLGRSRFFEAFREQTGMTPSDYIMRERCSRAREMLLTTDKSVTAIALDLGFCSSQYFATCFRKYAGTAPGKFRKKL
jgi:AraC family L-rhamnose operon regulatory protein RhaS